MRNRTILLTLVLSLLGPIAVKAATVTNTLTLPLTDIVLNGAAELSIDGFDTDLGTLEGVSIAFDGNFRTFSSLGILRQLNPSTNYQAQLSFFPVFGIGTTRFTSGTPRVTGTTNFRTFGGFFGQGGTNRAPVPFFSTVRVSADDVLSINSGGSLRTTSVQAISAIIDGTAVFDIDFSTTRDEILALFATAEPVPLSLAPGTAFRATDLNNRFNPAIRGALSTRLEAGSTLSVTYTYAPTAIPLPAGGFLLLGGGAALVVLRRMKPKKQTA